MDPLLTAFDVEFRRIDRDSRSLLATLPDELLFYRPSERPQMIPFSCGEYLIRSAAMVEQAFGGITARLWDDPFEWTLPEKLSNRSAILGYFNEVEEVRTRGFATFGSDADLQRRIPAPESLRGLADILVEAIAHARHYQGRAYALFQTVTDEKPPRLAK